MKYGNQLERESVPEWSLHNLDYNSLKHEIKVHTTRHQATAITIPGRQDVALSRFEDALYKELCCQHDRVDLFVTSKADEVLRRLEHISAAFQCRALRPLDDDSPGASLKRQRRFVKLERELLRCGEDIHALSRFANAQVVAFHKILKKYRKWTGSTTLSPRFNDIVLSDPKSFTRRSFHPLQHLHDDILQKLRDASPSLSEPGSPCSVDAFPRSPPRVSFDIPPQTKYWNEYDDGSDCGPPDDSYYAIYVDPNDAAFPGLKYILYPFAKAREWFSPRRRTDDDPQEPLLPPVEAQGYGAIRDSEDEEAGYASSDGFPQGYAAHFALPSLGDQRVRRYREKVLMWATAACFAASFVFLGIAGLLISTGRHKMHVEVDAGATVGAVVGLFCACCALGMTLHREDELSTAYRVSVWGTFAASCVLNGMLFVLILGNSA